MRELALFSGSGGGILGGKLLGWRTVCAVEIDAFCREVLLRRQMDGCLPRFPVWDDVRTFRGEPWRGFVDIVTGGFPCQAWSSAARGRNVSSNLWPEMLRIIGEICPRYVLAENVDEGAIIAAQADLDTCGYATRRARIAAAHVGADHPRSRWWLVANADGEGELAGSVYAKMGVFSPSREAIWAP